MDIFIDESGSFVCTDNTDAWSVVTSYVTYSSQREKAYQVLKKLKLKCSEPVRNEIKLKNISEENLKWFLSELSKLKGVVFTTATNTSIVNDDEVKHHASVLADKVAANINTMQYEAMKQSLRNLSKSITELSPQLYLQLHCQCTLIDDIIRRGTLYFSLKTPSALSSFKWNIDQKNTSKIAYEEAFENISPAILQSRSIENPMMCITEGNYSFMKHFTYGPGDAPTYLNKHYELDLNLEGSFNIGKILHDDMNFVDSKSNEGVQIADILASTTRRLLRNGFSDNKTIAKLLGSLMLENAKGHNSILFISINIAKVENPETIRNIKIIDRSSKAMF